MSTYEISKSSLVSLKAEILRKHQELANARTENERKIKVIKKNTPLEFKNKKINKDGITEVADTTEMDDSQELLRKSRLILEQKSVLYDKLRSGKLTDEERKNKNYLVRFDDNSFVNSDEEPDKYPESGNESELSEEADSDNIDSSEKWVDYVDCLGRTRKCMQKDLEYLKSKDDELRKVVEKRNTENNVETGIKDDNKTSNDDNTNTNTSKPTEEAEAELLSSDMRRQLLREQWEKEEEQLRQKSDVHYQDVLFGEARTHGVGYYGFSKDEEERFKQQEALKQLREETEQKQRRAQELKMIRDKQLAARIKAAKERRRARLGLPPEEETEPETSTEPKISEEEKQKQLELERQKEEKEKILEEARKRHLRPWDEGKEGVSKEHYVMSQEEWSELKRTERNQEFAPPTAYRKEKETKNLKDNQRNKKQKQKIKKRREDPELQSKKGQNFSFNNFEDTVSARDYNNISGSDETTSEPEVSRRGAAIPPPMNFDYFGPSASKLPRKSSEKNSINESIEAGLKFLRKQLEQKKKGNRDVDFIDC